METSKDFLTNKTFRDFFPADLAQKNRRKLLSFLHWQKKSGRIEKVHAYANCRLSCPIQLDSEQKKKKKIQSE